MTRTAPHEAPTAHRSTNLACPWLAPEPMGSLWLAILLLAALALTTGCDKPVKTSGGTIAADTGAEDTGAGDTGAGDTGAGDTGAGDTGAVDTSAADAAVADSDANSADDGDAGEPEPTWGSLCQPCTTNAQCSNAAFPNAKCVQFGANGADGAFCGAACVANTDCPGDYQCAAGQDVVGNNVKQCVPKAKSGGGVGVCACSPLAKAQNLATTCWVKGEGTAAELNCKGRRVCDVDGLSACTKLTGPNASCYDAQCAGIPDGKSCDDGEVCTSGDACQGGVCKSGSKVCCVTDDDCPQPAQSR